MLVHQSPAKANNVKDAVSATLSPQTSEYNVAVAYVTREGARALVAALSVEIGQDWQGIRKTIVTCFDFGHTEPTALEYLQTQGFDVRIANVGANGEIQLVPSPSNFHPKIYMAIDEDTVKAVIGSANLSRRAWTVNTEVVIIAELPREEASSIWDGIVESSVELTPLLLSSYQAIRPSQKSAQVADEPPVPPLPAPASLPVFRDAVAGGAVIPSHYSAFWIEAGSMSSGGSGNQLELPHYGNRFFGFDFSEYDNDRHPIGEITVTARTGAWQRPLVWHGDNRMERIYLPTTAKSGLVYPYRAVLFQRSGADFQIAVADPSSSRFRQWHDESAASGTLYRLAERSDRLCGLL